MKILIISQYYYPEQFQINEIAPELVKKGHLVTVVCGIPNYPKGIIFDGYGSKDKITQNELDYLNKTGVRVIYVRQKPRGNTPLSLLRNYYSFVKNSKRKVRELVDNNERYDVVLGYQLSPITSMYAAIEYKKLTGAPVVYYTLDLWPVSALAFLKSRYTPMFCWIKKISKKLYNSADKVIVTSRPFIDYLHKEVGLPVVKMSYLPQHASSDMLYLDLSSMDNGIADFLFAGNLGKGQRIDVIVNAAKLLGPRKDYRIHIVGDGRMHSKLEKMVSDFGLNDNVIFYGNQKREDMSNYYRMADALLITLRGNNEVGDTMPGKLQMYMTTGKPILGAINGAAHEVIDEAQCGSCVNAGDYQGLAKLMKSFIDHPEEYDVCGKNGRTYFKNHFTFEHYMSDLVYELEKLVQKD